MDQNERNEKMCVPAGSGVTASNIGSAFSPLPPPRVELGTNPKDLFGQKKPALHLVPPAAIVYTALAMEDGAVKYGAFNWRKTKVKSTVYVSAAIRHLLQYLDGEENASDSNKPHLAHALASISILVDATETGNLVDDRPVPGATSALIERYTKK